MRVFLPIQPMPAAGSQLSLQQRSGVDAATGADSRLLCAQPIG